MRIFWAIIAVLVVAGIGYPTYQAWESRSRAVAERAQAELEASKLRDEAAAAASAAAGRREASVDAPPREVKPTEPAPAPAPTPEAAPPPPSASTDEPKPATTESLKPAEATTPTVSVPVATPAPTPAGTPAAEPTPATPSEPTAPAAKVTKKDDGSMVIDDRFTVKGDGTAEKPYELSWELLTSIQESYDPRQGRKKLPDRLTMFDGTFVRLTGYIAFPMFVEEPRELLSMLNQWDGCCIGVPPTPYDAVEVHLAGAVTKDQRLAVFGTVEGKFLVKPYLAGDWLVGLYVMENAKVSVKQVGGFGS